MGVVGLAENIATQPSLAGAWTELGKSVFFCDWDTRTLGHLDNRTPGHWNTRTLGHGDTGTLGHRDTRTMGRVWVPTYRRRVVIFD